MNRSSLRNIRLKFKTAGELPIILEEFLRICTNLMKANCKQKWPNADALKVVTECNQSMEHIGTHIVRYNHSSGPYNFLMYVYPVYLQLIKYGFDYRPQLQAALDAHSKVRARSIAHTTYPLPY